MAWWITSIINLYHPFFRMNAFQTEGRRPWMFQFFIICFGSYMVMEDSKALSVDNVTCHMEYPLWWLKKYQFNGMPIYNYSYYLISSYSPSGGMKLMLCSASNLLNLTHWCSWQSSIAMDVLPDLPNKQVCLVSPSWLVQVHLMLASLSTIKSSLLVNYISPP